MAENMENTGIEFVDIFGMEAAYKVSRCGVVVSHKVRGSKSGKLSDVPRIIPFKYTSGYPMVQFCINGKTVGRFLHVILVETFILKGRKPKELHVRHLNGNKLDYRLENLAVGTVSENGLDYMKYTIGRQWNVESIKYLYENNWSLRKIGRYFNVSSHTVKNMLLRHGWSKTNLRRNYVSNKGLDEKEAQQWLEKWRTE
jgi:hypothetical protein